jgi:hypothetical protein
MNAKLAAGVALTLIAGMAACDDDPTSPTTTYTASLSAASEVPAPTGSPTATGTATLVLTSDRMLTVTVTVAGNLTSNVTMSHIHGPASAGATANIVLDFVPSMTAVINAGTRTGTIVSATYDLDALAVEATGVLRVSPETLIGMLNDGTAYVNVHTQTNPSGEIRGQVTK